MVSSHEWAYLEKISDLSKKFSKKCLGVFGKTP